LTSSRFDLYVTQKLIAHFLTYMILSTTNENTRTLQERKLTLKSRNMHGRYAYHLERSGVDKQHRTHAWKMANSLQNLLDLCWSSKTILLVAAVMKLLFEEPEYTCRKCRGKPVTIQHITGACVALTAGDYILCHNKVAKVAHQELTIKCGLSKGPQMPIKNMFHTSAKELMNCTITSPLQVIELSITTDHV